MPPSLTLDDIADGAIRLIEQLGPSKVTARNLGAELHVAAATLYTVVRSLDEVTEQARIKLAERWKQELDEVARSGSVAPFVDSIGYQRRNTALFMTDPTRTGPGSLDFARRLFPDVDDDDVLADRQAIVHSVIRTDATATDELAAALAAHTNALATLDQVDLPAPAGSPALGDVIEAVIADRVPGERRQLLTRVGIDLVEQGGVDEWVFRRVVEASGVPLTTVHRAGDRHAHLVGLAAVLSEAAWIRAGQDPAEGAMSTAARLGAAAREMQPGPNPSLLRELQRPQAGQDTTAPIVPSAIVDDPVVAPALPVMTAVFVSRYARATVAPGAWDDAPKLMMALAMNWSAA